MPPTGLGGPPRKYKNVEIVDARGSPLGELDVIENGVIIEEKSATGINTLHPLTGKPVQTPQEWAAKQIYQKTVVRIRNLQVADATRPGPGGSKIVPSIDEVSSIRELQFRVDANTQPIRGAVADQVERLCM